MKKMTTLITAITLSTVTFGAYAYGQNDFCKSQAKYQEAHGFHHHMKPHSKSCNRFQKMTPEQRQAKMEKRIDRKVERMAYELNLTQKQQHKLKRILLKRSEKKRELYRESRQQINQILNPEQREMMQSKRKA